MRAKLARINVMSGKQQRGKSSRREEAESSHRVRESSSHRLIVFQREFESSWVRRHEPSLYSRRSCESESPYREGEIYYRTRRTAPSTAGGSRPVTIRRLRASARAAPASKGRQCPLGRLR